MNPSLFAPWRCRAAVGDVNGRGASAERWFHHPATLPDFIYDPNCRAGRSCRLLTAFSGCFARCLGSRRCYMYGSLLLYRSNTLRNSHTKTQTHKTKRRAAMVHLWLNHTLVCGERKRYATSYLPRTGLRVFSSVGTSPPTTHCGGWSPPRI